MIAAVLSEQTPNPEFDRSAQRRYPWVLVALTIADIAVGLVVNRWFMINELERPEYPAVTACYDLLTERPACRLHGRNGLP